MAGRAGVSMAGMGPGGGRPAIPRPVPAPDITQGRLGPLVGSHPAMQRVFEQILLWAPTAANLVIAGETGSGKELVAHAVHDFSPRTRKAFVILDCSTLPKELLESELFGHERGAFTGAVGLHLGRFERANGGTLFLDEISNLSLEVQAKLLRVLQSRAFERIGGNREIRVDVRIVAASNKPLRECVEQGSFRDDLYHRLTTGVVEIPPLRERASDIPLLATEFLHSFKAQYLKDIEDFTPEALLALTRYPWPGNVRELRNVVERAVILSGEPHLGPSALPPHILSGHPEPRTGAPDRPAPLAARLLRSAAVLPLLNRTPPGPVRRAETPSGAALESSAPPPETREDLPPLPSTGVRLFDEVAEFERRLILRSLQEFQGNIRRTASWLGVSRTTMYKKLEAYGIDIDPLRGG